MATEEILMDVNSPDEEEENKNTLTGCWREKLGSREWWRARLLSRAWWIDLVTRAGKHLALLVLMVVYTCLGALVFQLLEYEVEAGEQRVASEQLQQSRHHLLSRLLTLAHPHAWNDTTPPDAVQVSEWLRDYEVVVVEGDGMGVNVLSPTPSPRWTYPQALFFSATVLTTIGYGNIAPSTVSGRAFCVVFAVVGIPLTLSVIANLGELLASVLPTTTIDSLLPQGRLRTIASVGCCLLLLLAYLTTGAFLFMLLESEWKFLDSFYFCFITTSTIGFGDLVPSARSLLICWAYILAGLALTTMVLELVRRQYAASWARVRELSARLHTLSGPLALAIRKMAETGAGQVEMDAELVAELRQLDLALADEAAGGGGGRKEKEKEEEKGVNHLQKDPWATLLALTTSRKRITVIMYESNV